MQPAEGRAFILPRRGPAHGRRLSFPTPRRRRNPALRAPLAEGEGGPRLRRGAAEFGCLLSLQNATRSARRSPFGEGGPAYGGGTALAVPGGRPTGRGANLPRFSAHIREGTGRLRPETVRFRPTGVTLRERNRPIGRKTVRFSSADPGGRPSVEAT